MEQTGFQLRETFINLLSVNLSLFDKYICLADITSLEISRSESAIRIDSVFSQLSIRAKASLFISLNRTLNQSQIAAASNKYIHIKVAVASLSAAPHNSVVLLNYSIYIVSSSSILTEQHADRLQDIRINAKALFSNQLHSSVASLFYSTLSRIAESSEKTNYQTSAVSDLIDNTNANEHLDNGLQNFAIYKLSRSAETFSTTENLESRARENVFSASIYSEAAESHKLSKKIIVFLFYYFSSAAFLAKMPRIVDSISKTN